jgi:hypothetical protein
MSRHGTEGYAEAAKDILKRYETIPSVDDHAPVLPDPASCP